MTKGKRLVASVVLLLALLSVVAGQYYFTAKREVMWDGVALYVVGIALFVAAWHAMAPRAETEASRSGVPIWIELWGHLGRSETRLVLLLGGLVLSAWVSVVAQSRVSSDPYYDLLALWGLGVIMAWAAFVDWTLIWESLKSMRLPRVTPEAALVAALVVATFLLRAVKIGSIPHVLSGDEASMGIEALDVLRGRRTNPFVTGWLSHPTLYFFMQAASLRLLGAGVAGLRFPSAVVSAGIALLLYLFARRNYGRRVAVVALLFFTCYHYATHFGRMALNNIWDPFFAVGALYFLSVGLRDKRVGHLAIGGCFTGLAAYGYMGARLIPIIIILYLIHWAVREPGFVRQHLSGLAVFGLCALVVAGPLLFYFSRHPSDLTARWKLVSVIASGWVEDQARITGKSEFVVLLGQFRKSILAFNYYTDPTFHYRPDRPLLLFVSAPFLVLGATYASIKWRRSHYWLLLIWVLLVVIFGSTLLENPPSSPRLVLAIPAICCLVAIGLVQTSDLVTKGLDLPKGWAVGLPLALVSLSCYLNLSFYFCAYQEAAQFSGPNTHAADQIGRYLHALGPDYRAYFYGPPRIYCRHATIPFLAPDVVCVDINEPLPGGPPPVDPSYDAVFVFLPERRDELGGVRTVYRTGLLREFLNDKGQLLFLSYEVDL